MRRDGHLGERLLLFRDVDRGAQRAAVLLAMATRGRVGVDDLQGEVVLLLA